MTYSWVFIHALNNYAVECLDIRGMRKRSIKQTKIAIKQFLKRVQSLNWISDSSYEWHFVKLETQTILTHIAKGNNCWFFKDWKMFPKFQLVRTLAYEIRAYLIANPPRRMLNQHSFIIEFNYTYECRWYKNVESIRIRTKKISQQFCNWY